MSTPNRYQNSVFIFTWRDCRDEECQIKVAARSAIAALEACKEHLTPEQFASLKSMDTIPAMDGLIIAS